MALAIVKMLYRAQMGNNMEGDPAKGFVNMVKGSDTQFNLKSFEILTSQVNLDCDLHPNSL